MALTFNLYCFCYYCYYVVAGAITTTTNTTTTNTAVLPLLLSGFRHPGNTPKNRFGVKTVDKPMKKPAPNVIQFQFFMPVIIKDFFMFTASNDQ